MKCRKIQRIVIATEESAWSAEIHTHLAQCPECGQIAQRTTIVQGLIALKRYEVPDPEAVNRCVDQLHDRIDEIRRLEKEAGPTPFLLPTPIYGLAAVCLILLGIHFAPSGAPTSLDTVVTDAGARTFEQFLLDGPRRDWQPYFVTMPTDEFTIPATISGPALSRPNSVFATNAFPRRR